MTAAYATQFWPSRTNVWRKATSPRTVTWDKSLMRFKSWLIAINTGAGENADACALAPL
jgi:hypothetical protein